MQAILPEIEKMLAEGKSHKQIEAFFGLTGDRPVHNLLKRERRKSKEIKSRYSSQTERPSKEKPLTTAAEYEKEISRLKMENELLRDFLRLTGRK